MSFSKIHKIIFSCIIAGGILICNLNASADAQYYKQGIQSEEVKQIQTELKKLGFFNSEITGFYGDVTKNAVMSYQRANGFSVDGVVGPATWKVLVGTSQSSPSGANTSSGFKSVLKIGSQGELVKKLQLKLKEIGYFSDKATGYYGQVTSDCVKKYQTADGTTADGIVGQNTWNSLFGTGTSQNGIAKGLDGTLKDGVRSDKVKQAQEKLKELGYFKVNATGVYGSITVESVKSFQKANGITADGVIGSTTWDKLFSGTSISAGSRTTISRGGLDRDAVTKDSGLISWEKVSKIFKNGTVATVIDINTGIEFNMKRTFGTSHADVEPLTADDTYKLKQAYGGTWSWDRRPVVVIVGGQKFAGSMNGMPHAGIDSMPATAYVSNRSGGYGYGQNLDAVKNNNMDGQTCIHFLNSTTHGSGNVDPLHQAAIKKAAKYLENN